jgi:hypothetical protein
MKDFSSRKIFVIHVSEKIINPTKNDQDFDF